MFEENSDREITRLKGYIVFEELRFQTFFCSHQNKKLPFSNSSGLKSVFVELRFRDGLVWTEGLTVEIKLRFQISPAYCGRYSLKGMGLLKPSGLYLGVKLYIKYLPGLYYKKTFSRS